MPNLLKRDGEMTRTFPAALVEIDRLCDEARDFFVAHQLQHDLFALELLLREALVNAVVHGCGENARLSVQCDIRIDLGTVTLTVTDPGDGFDWQQQDDDAPDPTSSCGRGLMIFQQYAQDVVFNATGNCVTIRRAICQ